MPTRGLMLPTREIGPRLSDKSKSLAGSIACAAASAAGRFRMVVLNGHRHVDKTMRRGFARLPGPAICMGIASLDTLWPKLSRVRPGLKLSMLFELEVLLTWACELRLEYEVGS